MKKRYEINMTKGPLLPELLQFILPLMLSSMLQIAFNAADLIVVGRFGRPHSMAAVGANGAMINLIINVLMGLATGGGVLCARYYGANQTDKLHRTVSTTLITGVIGGVIIGAGLGIVFIAGASTGGVDIVARLLKLKFRNFPIGKILLCMDLCTAVATGIVYGEFNNTLYSVITLVLSSFVLDKVVYGMDYAKVALIISDRYEEIAQAIDTQLDRGVTLLHGQGFYLRSDKFVLLSAVKRKQLAQLKDLVMSIDPSAFIILQDAHQVLGDGFKRYDRNEL